MANGKAKAGAGASAAGAVNYLGRDSAGAQLHREQHGELPHARLDTGEELRDTGEIRRAAAEMAESHQYRYSFTVSPDPEVSRQWTEQDWAAFTNQVQEKVSALKPESESLALRHPDPEHPHVHVQVYCDRTFNKSELNELRAATTEATWEVERGREHSREPERTGPEVERD